MKKIKVMMNRWEPIGKRNRLKINNTFFLSFDFLIQTQINKVNLIVMMLMQECVRV